MACFALRTLLYIAISIVNLNICHHPIDKAKQRNNQNVCCAYNWDELINYGVMTMEKRAALHRFNTMMQNYNINNNNNEYDHAGIML